MSKRSRKSQRIKRNQVQNQARRGSSGRTNRFGGSTRFGNSNIGYELVGGYHAADRKRQIWDQAGYPELVLPEMLWNMYRRGGLAKGIVGIKAGETWQNDPIVYDGDEDPERREKNPTEFEKALDEWSKKWCLWERLAGADRRQMVMRYSGLIIFAREPEPSTPDKPLQQLMGPEAITKIMPVFETEIEVNQAIQDAASPDYGQPRHFQFRSEVVGSRNTWIEQDFELHPSRVVTFAEGADDGSIYGIPEFEGYYNALLDLEKIRMAGGEGFYKNASQKLSINLNPELVSGLSDDQQKDFDDSLDDFARDMNQQLVLAGAEAKTLQSSMVNPKEYLQAAYNEVAAGCGLPLTILIGQQTGRLASDEDQSQKNVLISARQKNWGSSMVEKMLNHLVKYGALPEPKGQINVCWPDVTEPSIKDKTEVAAKMMEVNERAVKSMQDSVFTTEYIQGYMDIAPVKVERDPQEGSTDDSIGKI